MELPVQLQELAAQLAVAVQSPAVIIASVFALLITLALGHGRPLKHVAFATAAAVNAAVVADGADVRRSVRSVARRTCVTCTAFVFENRDSCV
jgi:hypothetical protein